jgi:hypothetical protein
VGFNPVIQLKNNYYGPSQKRILNLQFLSAFSSFCPFFV